MKQVTFTIRGTDNNGTNAIDFDTVTSAFNQFLFTLTEAGVQLAYAGRNNEFVPDPSLGGSDILPDSDDTPPQDEERPGVIRFAVPAHETSEA